MGKERATSEGGARGRKGLQVKEELGEGKGNGRRENKGGRARGWKGQ